MMELKEIIGRLCKAAGPSGFEDGVRAEAMELLLPNVDEIKVEAMGNLAAFMRCADANAPTLMLSAHMDEVGLMVTGHEAGGFLRFAAIGGVDPRTLPAQEITILTDPPLAGIVSVMPPHVLSAGEMEKAIEIDALFIDTGLSEEEAKKLIPPGTPALISSGTEELGDGFFCGRALDDRACAAILIKTIEELAEARPSINIVLLLTVQEEIGRRGARTGAYGVEPDCAIAVDVTFGRTPDSKREKTFPLGSGAAIGVGPSLNRGMTQSLFETARSLNIPFETEVLAGDSGTDGWVIELTRDGIPTALVSLPIRYMHSPVECMKLSDAEAVKNLLVEYVRNAEVCV